jgi:hypothetical protein
MKHHADRHETRHRGQGDDEVARRFDKAERAFMRSGRLNDAMRGARPRDAEEAEELAHAEAIGRSHTKDEDPAAHRPDAHRD